MLNRDQLVALGSTVNVKTVNAPEMGEVGLRMMTVKERELWEEQSRKDGTVNFGVYRASLLVKVLCNPDGSRMFNDDEIDLVSSLPGRGLRFVFDKAAEFNAVYGEDIEEATKN
jgi:hypothetical protein